MTSADHHTSFRYAAEGSVGFLFDLVWGLKTVGLENVPPTGPLILVGNHTSITDGNVLAWAVRSVRRPRFLAKAELFSDPFRRWLFTTAGCIPVDRKGDATAALRAATSVLQGGGSLVMFPEGGRVKPGSPRAPKAGVSFLAAAASAPVLPARLLGPESFPFARMEVRLGKPLPPPPPGKDAAKDFAQAVMDAVYRL